MPMGRGLQSDILLRRENERSGTTSYNGGPNRSGSGSVRKLQGTSQAGQLLQHLDHGQPHWLFVWQGLLRQDHRAVRVSASLKNAIKQKARQLGFTLAGVTSSAAPTHYEIFASWLDKGM